MKRIVLTIAIIATLCLTGCGTLKDKDIRNSFLKDVEGLKSYYMEGTLKITNNDDTYEYNVEVCYKKDNKYKVSLKNKANDYEQIILKNDDGVYVITPSLNKSFKFQSDWPDNNSQSYLLDSVANDLKNDSAYKFTQKDKNYIFTTKTNYPNNPQYVKQNIIIDSNRKLQKVEVQDENGVTYIEFTPKTIDNRAKFNDSQFSLEEVTKNFSDNSEMAEEESKENNNNTDTNTEDNNTESTSKIDETIFPLYLPTNTTLSDKEVISTENGERVIMTFSGDNPFVLVEETVKPSQNLEIIPTYGEPFMLVDAVGSLTDTSYTWTSGGVEYYIVSDQMNKNELLEVAKSINVVSAINQK
ncbi:MAG: outer membrane lipoprotein carrier protein LolA [Bacilli bacterium]|nr:outer membrane lipoprotein carrier protein LolA [Bacilli bacterium]